MTTETLEGVRWDKERGELICNLKTVVMNPLQQQLAEKGRCPHCKARLQYKYTGGGMDFHQCLGCLNVYVLAEVPKLLG